MSALKRRQKPFAHLDRRFSRPALVDALAAPISNLDLPANEGPVTIGLTSSRRGEGVTTLTLYLGRQLAETFDVPTLIVEANFRRPAMARYCRLDAHSGLHALLSDSAVSLADAVYPVEGTTLAVLPSGGTHANPLSLFAGGRLSRFLAAARERYRLIVIDTPPVLSCSETIATLESADRRALVVEADRTAKGDVTRSIELLRDHGAEIQGTILNRRRFLFG